jgi:hypothetical protein
LAAWQAGQLQKEKSEREAKLVETLETLKDQSLQVESEQNETIEDKGTCDIDLEIVGLKKIIVDLREEIRTIEVCIDAIRSFRHGSMTALATQTMITSSSRP